MKVGKKERKRLAREGLALPQLPFPGTAVKRPEDEKRGKAVPLKTATGKEGKV